MSVTVTAQKTVSFKSPYTGSTFQRLAELLLGQDGYISGGAASDNGSLITVAEFFAVQRGILMESLAAISTLTVPTTSEPWYLVAAVSDDDPDTGIIVTATDSLNTGGVVIAIKDRGVWSNPNPVNVKGLAGRAAEQGVDTGFETEAFYASGALTDVVVNLGDAVTPDGFHADLPAISGSSARVGEYGLSEIKPYVGIDRRDYVVIRQIVDSLRSDPAQIEYLRGEILETFTMGAIEAAAGMDRAHCFSEKGGVHNATWWTWADGTALRGLRVAEGGLPSFGPSTILTGAGNVTGTWVCGQNAAGSVVVLYLDGTTLKLVSFDPDTGAVVDAAVVVSASTFTAACLRPRGIIDSDGYLHLIVEYTTGGSPTQQIYYGKYDLDTSFGLEAITPRNVNVSHSSKNDTWPSIGIDRRGIVHVAHISGTGTAELGEFVYATIVAGVTITRDMYLTTQVGIDLQKGSAFEQSDMTNFRRTALVVTPHDEVYVATGGIETSSTMDVALLFSPGFESRLGFPLVNIAPPGSAFGSGRVPQALDICSGERGELYYAYADRDVGGGTSQAHYFTLNPVIAPEGTLTTDTICMKRGLRNEATDASNNGEACFMRRGPRGGVLATILFNNSAQKRFCTANLLTGSLGDLPVKNHPNDICLAVINVPGVASASAYLETDSPVGIFSTRPKKMNYPILVGDRGDYQGYNAFRDAVMAAHRHGGDIVVRSGRHVQVEGAGSRVRIQSGGISIRGEGESTIEFSSGSGFSIYGNMGAPVVSISGNLLEITVNVVDTFIRPGDYIRLNTSGFHRVLKSLGADPSNSTTHRFLLAPNATGGPVGTTCASFPTGVTIENLTLKGVWSAAWLTWIQVKNLTMRNVAFEGTLADPSETILTLQSSFNGLIDGIDLQRLDITNKPTVALSLEAGDGNIIRGAMLQDGGSIGVADTEHNLHLVDCHGDGSDASKDCYDLDGTRTSPVFMTDCEGRVAGDVGWLVTNVGRRVRLPEGGGALELEDDNTRAGAITDDGIKLTDGSNQEFNGTTNDVVTTAVNERVRKAGDTMSGNLEMSANIITDGTARTLGGAGAGYNFNIYGLQYTAGGNFVTDGTARTLGGAGAGYNFNIFGLQYTAGGNFVTDGTTRFIGTSGAGNTFYIYANGITSDGDIVPDATGRDLGNATHRWDAHLEKAIFHAEPVPATDGGTDVGTSALHFRYFFGQNVQLHASSPTSNMMDVRGDVDQTGSLAMFRGRPNREPLWYVDAFGLPRAQGFGFFDDFNYERKADPTTPNWEKGNTSGANGSLEMTGDYLSGSIGRIEMGTTYTIGDQYRMDSGCMFNPAQGLTFTCRMRWAVPSGDGIFKIGLSEETGNNAYFYQVGTGNLKFIAYSFTIDTGITIGTREWRLLHFGVANGFTNIKWAVWVVFDQFDYGTLGSPLAEDTEGGVPSAPQVDRSVIIDVERAGNTLALGLDIDWIECWGVNRSIVHTT